MIKFFKYLVFGIQGEENYKNILLTLGNPDQKSVGKDII